MVKKKRWHCLPGQPVTELDKQVMFWENKGKLVPTRDLIKTPEQIEGIRKSGVVNTGCLDAVAEMIRPGINTQQIDDLCMQYCKDHNAIPACLILVEGDYDTTHIKNNRLDHIILFTNTFFIRFKTNLICSFWLLPAMQSSPAARDTHCASVRTAHQVQL